MAFVRTSEGKGDLLLFSWSVCQASSWNTQGHHAKALCPRGGATQHKARPGNAEKQTCCPSVSTWTQPYLARGLARNFGVALWVAIPGPHHIPCAALAEFLHLSVPYSLGSSMEIIIASPLQSCCRYCKS